MKRSGTLLVAAAFTLAGGLAAHAGPGAAGHSHAPDAAYGKPGDPKKAGRTIDIGMHEGDGRMYFTHAEIRVKAGETVRLRVKNHGHLDHELVIDTPEGNAKHKIAMEKNPDMEHDDPNAIRLGHAGDGQLVWHFTRKGVFEYACLIPGHYEAGMKGRIIVE